MLTADTSTITDDNGLTGPVYTYQWTRLDADGSSNPTVISGATAQTYTLVDADLGKRLQVTVSFTDDDNFAEVLTANTEVVAATDNNPATGLTISGTAKVGEMLTAETSTITDADGLSGAAYTYQWTRVDDDGTSNPTTIASATSQTYTLVNADKDKQLRVTVQFVDDNGYAEAPTALSGVIAKRDNVHATGLTISGTEKVDHGLRAETSGITDANGLTSPVYTYQWTRLDAGSPPNPETIVGATSQIYTLVKADEGKRLQVTVGFTDDDGYAENITTQTGVIAKRDNVPATGLTISGTEKVGEMLTAVTSGITDHNGLSSAVYTYQWSRLPTSGPPTPVTIVGATAQTYTLVRADAGRRVRVTVNFTDDDDYAERLETTTGVVAKRDNVAATGLTLSGTEKVGQVLTADTSGITDANGLTSPAYTYQWTRVDSDGSSNPTNIAGATSQTYTLVKADEGKRLRVTVRFTDDDGYAEAPDTLSGEIAKRDNVAATGLTFSGMEKVGEVLTVDTSGITDANGLTGAAYTYQWTRVDADGSSNPTVISTATAQTYTLIKADEGKRLRMTVSFTDNDNYAEELTTDSGVIAKRDNVAATGLTLSGTEQIGAVLTADTSGITDANGLTGAAYTWQWTRVDADGSSNPTVISAATSQTYTLADADLGKRLRVTVSFTDDDNYAETPNALSGVIAQRDNVLATGLTLSGTEKVGAVLTADTSGITDANGLTGATYTWQWTRVDADGSSNPTVISAATAQTYTLADADLGKRLRVTVSFTDDDNYAEALNALSGVIAARDNELATGLTLSGTEKVGAVLTADTSGISDDNGLTGAVYTYQWTRVDADGSSNPTAISAATAQTYTLVRADEGKRLRVTVSFTDDDNYAEALDALSGVIAKRDNVAATGLTLSGTAKVGEVLTAVTSTITDGNGLTGAAYTYQWTRVDADGTSNPTTISGATARTYTLADADRGKRLRVTASFTDDDNHAEAPDALSAVIAAADNNPAAGLTISGTAKVGAVLTADTSTITDADGLTGAAYAYQWTRVDADGSSNPTVISTATAQTYTLVDADLGKRLRVAVNFADDRSNPEALEALSGVIAQRDNVAATGLTLSGTEKVGEVLTADTSTITDSNGLSGAAYTYQWTRVDADGSSNPTNIAGATSQTYTLIRADAGKRLRVTVRFTDDDGYAETVSALSGVIVTRDNVAATGLTLSGTEKVHQVLTAETGTITDGNGLTGAVYTYQWARVDADGTSNPTAIPGATAQTYTLADADLGKRLRVTVQFTDDDFHAEAPDALSGVIAAPDNVAATGLAISGRAMVRRSLTARADRIRDGNGLTQTVYTYQWARVDADGTSNLENIVGATAQAYTMADADLGKRMRVTVRFTDDDGYAEELNVTSGVVVEFRPVDESRVAEGTLTRVGSTTTVQVLRGVQQRFDAPRVQGVQTSFAGQHAAWGQDPGAWNPDGGTVMRGLQALTTRSAGELLTGSSLLLSARNAGGGYTSLWARGAYDSWSGKDGETKLDGSVRTGQIGADWSSGPWLVGVSLAHSTGGSGYAAEGETGTTDTTLNSVYPYARYQFTEQDSLWVTAGRGTGSLTLEPGGGDDPVKTGIGMTMGAVGVQVGMPEMGDADGLELAVNADFAYVRMTSEAVTGRLEATSPNANRLRVGLEGSRRIQLGNGATLVPAGALGVRRDSGEVSPGTGIYAGAALTWIDPVRGLSFDLRGHSLLAHEVSGTREWGISGVVRYDADQRTGEGLSWALDSGFGARPAGGMDALFAADAIEDLGAADKDDPGEHLKLEVGYGMPAFGNAFTSTPSAKMSLAETGSAWRLGWQLTSARTEPLNISGGVNVAPRDGEYSVGLLVSARF